MLFAVLLRLLGLQRWVVCCFWKRKTFSLVGLFSCFPGSWNEFACFPLRHVASDTSSKIALLRFMVQLMFKQRTNWRKLVCPLFVCRFLSLWFEVLLGSEHCFRCVLVTNKMQPLVSQSDFLVFLRMSSNCYVYFFVAASLEWTVVGSSFNEAGGRFTDFEVFCVRDIYALLTQTR